MGKKLWRYMSFSSTEFFYYRKHPNNNINITRYHLCASSSTFMTDSHDLDTIQVRRNLLSIPFDENASFSHQARTLKTDLLQFNIKLSSNEFTALEFDSHYFGVLLWKIVKSGDHNEINPLIGKIFWKYKPIRHYFMMSRK